MTTIRITPTRLAVRHTPNGTSITPVTIDPDRTVRTLAGQPLTDVIRVMDPAEEAAYLAGRWHTYLSALDTITQATGARREQIRAGVTSGHVKAWVKEDLGMLWSDWKALPVASRDRLVLIAHNA